MYYKTQLEKYENNSTGTSKITVAKYGDLIIYKSCENISEMRVSCSLKNVDSKIYDESDLKKITEDKGLVLLIVDSNCLIVDYRIHRAGKLDSFNIFVEMFCKEIILQFKEKDLKDVLFCDKEKCGNLLVPMKIKILTIE